MNEPVVCDNTNSDLPEKSAFFATYPIAPLARPLTFDPMPGKFEPVNSLHFKIVNV